MSEPLTFTLPPEVFEQLVEAVTARVLERTGEQDGSNGWPEWLDVKTAAAYLGSEPGVVRKLIERRRVPYSQEGPGCKVWIARRDLDAYMESARQDAYPTAARGTKT